jgi:RHS repeat-associated protein
MDRSSNRVVAAALALTLTAGVVYSGPAQGSTAVAPMPRSAVGVDLGFSAHLHDATSGLILARARVLDPLTGAFLSKDPYGYQDSVNQYAYGANDPINHRDPTGMEYVGTPENGPTQDEPDGSDLMSMGDWVSDGGFECSVGACTSEIDMTPREMVAIAALPIEAAAGGAGALVCTAQPEFCMALSAASASMSSGPSQEDALVFGTLALGPAVRGVSGTLRARQAARLAGITRDPQTGRVLSITPPKSQLGMLNISLLPKAKPGSPRAIALGLGGRLPAFVRDKLRGKAEMFPFPSFTRASDGAWQGIQKAMNGSKAIHFNLEGVERATFRKWLDQGGHLAEPAPGSIGFTNRELYEILTRPDLLKKTRWHGGSAPTSWLD